MIDRDTAPRHPYVNLETPDLRRIAQVLGHRASGVPQVILRRGRAAGPKRLPAAALERDCA
jgi:hypothetical protein